MMECYNMLKKKNFVERSAKQNWKTALYRRYENEMHVLLRIALFQRSLTTFLNGARSVFQGISERTINTSISGLKYDTASTIAIPLFMYVDPIVIAILFSLFSPGQII